MRLEACAGISSKFEPLQDDDEELVNKMRRELVNLGREGMFKSLVRCTSDSDDLVRLTAVGALRNLAITGRDKALVLMQQEDAWSAMCSVVVREVILGHEITVAARREALHVMELMCEASEAISERRLPDSLQVVSHCLSSQDRDTVEASAKLLFTASDHNLPLARAMLSTETGRAIGALLESLAGNFTRIAEPGVEETLIASAYAMGVLLNLATISEIQELPLLVSKWFEVSRGLLAENTLPQARLSDEILRDALEFEEDVIDEEGQTKKESQAMKRYLDVIQAQALVFDCWGDLLRHLALQADSDNKAKRKFWSGVISSLESNGIIPACLMFALNGVSPETPKSLSLAVCSLQERAAECASAAFDVFSSVPMDLHRETFSRVLEALTSTLPSDKSRAIAYASLVAASARTAEKSVIGSDLEASQILRMLQESSIEEVRALMCGPVRKLCESNPSQFLPILAPVLIDQLKKEKSIIVASEVADTLIDLFSEDDRQPLLDSLQGVQTFSALLKTFDKRITDAKRSVDAPADDDAIERMMDIKTNIAAFVDWRKSM